MNKQSKGMNPMSQAGAAKIAAPKTYTPTMPAALPIVNSTPGGFKDPRPMDLTPKSFSHWRR